MNRRRWGTRWRWRDAAAFGVAAGRTNGNVAVGFKYLAIKRGEAHYETQAFVVREDFPAEHQTIPRAAD